MSSKLSKNQLEKFSRQIILKDIGILGQKKILNSRVLIIGMGGLGCPVAEFLTRSGVGSLGIVDHDLVGLSNICLLYTSPSPRDGLLSRMPSSA